MKKGFLLVCPIVCMLVFAHALAPSPAQGLTVNGTVRQPLNLTAQDLLQFVQAQARVTELDRKGQYGGVFEYRGVPLRTLLEMAVVRKEVDGFSKPINLAIVVRNREGKSVVLSWGEVFYKDPSRVILALSAAPVVPQGTKSCAECHKASFYEPVLEKLKHTITSPKLVVADDFFTDRNLEDVSTLEVVDLNREVAGKEGQGSSPTLFTITDGRGGRHEIAALSGYGRVEVAIKVVGSGRGYHGFKRVEGIPLKALFKGLEVTEDLDSAFLVTSTDGYQSLFSSGELFLSPLGDRIVMGEEEGGKKYSLLVPHDALADRMVKRVSSIEAVSLRPKGKLYVIGVGCGDSNLITLDAISHMGRVDAFISPADLAKRFATYMGGKAVLFDPFASFEPVFRKKHPELKPEEAGERAKAQRATEMKSLRETLAAGKSVGVLDYGDPTVYGGWQHWLEPEFSGRIEIVPGISALSAANAMMGYNLACEQDSMIVTTPKALEANRGMLKTVAAKGDPLVVYMGLKDVKDLASLLLGYYPGDTPVVVAYKAGYSREERLLRTKLDRMVADTEGESEQHLGLIYIGRSLR